MTRVNQVQGKGERCSSVFVYLQGVIFCAYTSADTSIIRPQERTVDSSPSPIPQRRTITLSSKAVCCAHSAWLLADSLSIVAVHGLGGDWEATWTDSNGQLWLRDFLPTQIPPARIMSYGYNSNTIFTRAVTDITDEAAMLLDRLDNEREGELQRTKPIIFVAHSLGGIVVKKVSYSPSSLTI